MRKFRNTCVAAIAIAAFALPATAHAACTTYAKPLVHTSGTRFVENGQPINLHGVVVPYAKPALSQVAQLKSHGLNFVRLKVPWSQIETAPKQYAAAADAKLVNDVAAYRSEGVNVLIDFHRLGWSPYFGDKPGIPAWYYADGRFPATPAGRAAAMHAWWTSETARALAAYEPFVHHVMSETACYSNVVGYEEWNEPDGKDSQKATHHVLTWQRALLLKMIQWDPHRKVFFMLRHGGDLGFKEAHMMKAFFGTAAVKAHTVLDLHSYYNGMGSSPTGMDATGNTWLRSWTSTHNQNDADYHGTKAEQWANFDVTYAKTLKLDIPILVGEWGVQNVDTGAVHYCNQMLTIFRRHNISWTYFTLDTSPLFGMLTSSGGFVQQGCTPTIIQAL